MDTIPTADELFQKYAELYQFEESPTQYLVDERDFKTAMIEFAKLHTEAAIKAIVKSCDNEIEKDFIDEKLIVNSYPITNIK